MKVYTTHTHIYKGCSQSPKPHPKRRDLAEHFYCGSTLPPLVKLEKSDWVFLTL